MQANELRLGNLVTRKFNKNIQCTVNWGIIKDVDDGSGDYIPITLTPEILEKCGFKYSDSSFHHITYEKEPLAVSFVKSIDLGHDEVIISLEDRIIDCRFLHQLQNLFYALTGEELEVKL